MAAYLSGVTVTNPVTALPQIGGGGAALLLAVALLTSGGLVHLVRQQRRTKVEL